MNLKEEAIKLHTEARGKLEIKSKVNLKTREDLSLAYTPGVAEPCKEIALNKAKVYDYTWKWNSVAVVSDGSAVLGLGNIGPEAGLPVMEGKAILFKEFGKIDAVPIVLSTQNPDEIVAAVRAIAPTFGGINLEDIAAPACFEVESKLMDLGIPVFHDDQHGTAVVVMAALLNSAKVVGKEMADLKVVIFGAGAAGIVIAKMLKCYGFDKKVCKPVKDVVLLDSKGIIWYGREDLNIYKKEIAEITNRDQIKGGLADAVRGADVFIGVSTAKNILTPAMIKSMNKDPVVFALSNPDPEIMPDAAKVAGAAVIGTGRSDFPNQINNVLAFPGIFRGALDARAEQITNEMKIAASHALADCVDEPSADRVLPDPLDKKVGEAVARAVKKAWMREAKRRTKN